MSCLPIIAPPIRPSMIGKCDIYLIMFLLILLSVSSAEMNSRHHVNIEEYVEVLESMSED